MAMCSDHFSPWSARQGHSGYTWAWLGAALATTDLTMGCVSAPGQRYHPAVAAQKIATLAQMFEGRFWVALGSGEASNEHVTGGGWPRKELRDRIARGDETIPAVLGRAKTDAVVGKTKVADLLKSLPGYGPAKVSALLEQTGIDASRRAAGLGDRQKQALLDALG